MTVFVRNLKGTYLGKIYPTEQGRASKVKALPLGPTMAPLQPEKVGETTQVINIRDEDMYKKLIQYMPSKYNHVLLPWSDN